MHSGGREESDGEGADASGSGRRERVAVAWAALLVFSDLPEVVFHSLAVEAPAGLAWVRTGTLALLVALVRARSLLRPLTPFAVVLLVFHLALRGSAALGALPAWRGLFESEERSFALPWFGLFARDFAVAMAVLAALWAMSRDRRSFFFARGDLGAPIEPVRWLGIRKREPWRPFPWIFGGVAAIVTAAVVVPSLRPTGEELARAAALLPTVVLLSAVNAFDEEICFRLALLGTLPAAVGRAQAMAMNVVLFGLAHYLAGSPGGLPGFAMTGFLAYLMGKSVLETRGLLGAWIIHVLPDLVIFSTYAVLWLRG
jgi:membrane protease YdiL (CAAX protease family)